MGAAAIKDEKIVTWIEVFIYPSILPDLTFHDPTPDLTSQNIKQPYKSLKTTPVFQITKSFSNLPIQPQQNQTSLTHSNANSQPNQSPH